MVVWWTTRTECVSAFVRSAREGILSAGGERDARRVLDELEGHWAEIQPTESVRTTAERLLAVHTLRAADAFQLAAALEWVQAKTRGASLVTLDARLQVAADREGFLMQPPTDEVV